MRPSLIVFFLFCCSSVGLATLFVSPGGAGDCSRFSQPCSLQLALAIARPGETILMSGGNYSVEGVEATAEGLSLSSNADVTGPTPAAITLNSAKLSLSDMVTSHVVVNVEMAASFQGSLSFVDCIFNIPSTATSALVLAGSTATGNSLSLIRTAVNSAGPPLVLATDGQALALSLDSVKLTSTTIWTGNTTRLVITSSTLTDLSLTKLAASGLGALALATSTIQSTQDFFGPPEFTIGSINVSQCTFLNNTNLVMSPGGSNRTISMSLSNFFNNNFGTFVSVDQTADYTGLTFVSNRGSPFSSITTAFTLSKCIFNYNHFDRGLVVVQSGASGSITDLLMDHNSAAAPMIQIYSNFDLIQSTFTNNRLEQGLIRVENVSSVLSKLQITANEVGRAILTFSRAQITLAHSEITYNSLVTNHWNTSTVFHLMDAETNVEVTSSVLLFNLGPSLVYFDGPFCYQASAAMACLSSSQICFCSGSKQHCAGCKVVNPCAIGTDLCDHSSTICVPSDPGRYTCECKSGYKRPDQVDKKKTYSCEYNSLGEYLASPDGSSPQDPAACKNETCSLEYLLDHLTSGYLKLGDGVYAISRSFVLQPERFYFEGSSATFDFQGKGSFSFVGVVGSQSKIDFTSVRFVNLGQQSISASNELTVRFWDSEFAGAILPANVVDSVILMTNSSVEFNNCTVRGIDAPSGFFAVVIGRQVTLSNSRVRANIANTLFAAMDGNFAVEMSSLTANRVTLAAIARILPWGASSDPLNWIVDTTFEDNVGPLVLCNSAPLDLQRILVRNNQVDKIDSQLIRLAADKSYQDLYISDSIFTNTTGVAIGTVGVLSALNVSCIDSTDTCFHFPSRGESFTSGTISTIKRCRVVGARVAPNRCGMAIKISDYLAEVNVYNSYFADNIGGLGLFCGNIKNCTNDQYILTLITTELADNHFPAGCGEVYFSGPSVPPNCKDHVNSHIGDLSSSSYPVAFESTQTVAEISSAADQIVHFDLALLDFYGKDPPPVTISDYFLCYQLPAQVKSFSANPLRLSAARFSLEFTVLTPQQANISSDTTIKPQDFTISFGPFSCPNKGNKALRKSKMLTIRVTDAPPPSLAAPGDSPAPPPSINPLIPGLGIPGVTMLAVAVVVVAAVYYCRRAVRRNPRLISKAGLLQIETLTKLLTDANVPLVEVDDLELIETIGSGATGVVLRGTWPDRGDMEIAVKQHSYLTIQTNHWEGATKRQMEELITELKVLIQLDHPHVLPLLAVCINGPTDIRLVSPYMANRSLAMHLPTLDDVKRMRIARQIAWALEYLRTKSIVHRDLKPENVLLSQNWTAYVSDFARSEHSTRSVANIRGLIGSAAYSAPEAITNGKVGFQSDVYSYGVIVLELLTKKRAYPPEIEPTEVLFRISEGRLPTFPPEYKDPTRRPKWIPEGFVELIERCLDPDPVVRPSIKEVCDILKSFAIV